MIFKKHDGGRKATNFTGTTDDCVVRAIAIATDRTYHEIYKELFDRSKAYAFEIPEGRKSMRNTKIARAIRSRSASPRNGVYKEIYEPYILELGFTWESCMGIGTGCKVHLRKEELPEGTLIVRLSRHVACVIDGVLHDTYDCSREGTRCVYGYWRKS